MTSASVHCVLCGEPLLDDESVTAADVEAGDDAVEYEGNKVHDHCRDDEEMVRRWETSVGSQG